jgi:hypothetical protein
MRTDSTLTSYAEEFIANLSRIMSAVGRTDKAINTAHNKTL